MNDTLTELKTYRIRVGHCEIHVKAHDAAEALELGRRALAHELPRLYDVICRLTANRFEVEAAA